MLRQRATSPPHPAAPRAQARAGRGSRCPVRLGEAHARPASGPPRGSHARPRRHGRPAIVRRAIRGSRRSARTAPGRRRGRPAAAHECESSPHPASASGGRLPCGPARRPPGRRRSGSRRRRRSRRFEGRARWSPGPRPRKRASRHGVWRGRQPRPSVGPGRGGARPSSEPWESHRDKGQLALEASAAQRSRHETRRGASRRVEGARASTLNEVVGLASLPQLLDLVVEPEPPEEVVGLVERAGVLSAELARGRGGIEALASRERVNAGRQAQIPGESQPPGSSPRS